MSRFTQESALAFLRAADVFYASEPDPDEPGIDRQLNMNDTWGWACAFGQDVPDDKLIEVAQLFWRYGWAGCLYWTSEQNEQMRSEFHDINRMVDFVRHEEALRQSEPNSSKRAYTQLTYTLGSAEQRGTGQ